MATRARTSPRSLCATAEPRGLRGRTLAEPDAWIRGRDSQVRHEGAHGHEHTHHHHTGRDERIVTRRDGFGIAQRRRVQDERRLGNFTGDFGLTGEANAYTESLATRLATFVSVLWDYAVLVAYPAHHSAFDSAEGLQALLLC